MFEIKKELSPPIAKEKFNQTTDNYTSWHFSNLAYTIPKAFYRTESISFLGPKIMGTIPGEFEELGSLSLFRKAIKNVNLKIIIL